MKHIDKLGSLLSEPLEANKFELRHQFKLLKIHIAKLESDLAKVQNDKYIMENHLNSTISDLEQSNLKIRELRRKELKAVNKKIRFEQSRLEQITHSMTSSMAYIDRSYTYQYINHMYEKWFGVSKDQLLGQSVENVIGNSFFKMIKPIYEKVFEGNYYDYDYETVYNDERLFLKVYYVPAFDEDGTNIGLYTYATNITENKIVEAELKKSKKELAQKNSTLQEYIESNVQLEQFAHIAAHDMKAPLRSISSFAKLLQKKLQSTLGTREEEFFNIISDSTNSLNNLISNLLDYSKVGSKKIELTEVNTSELLQQVLTFLRSAITEKDATIIIDQLPKTIKADRTKLYQVFQNLISNALKFNDINKPIIKITYSDHKTFHCFIVKDNGIGMEKEHCETIFESFKRLHTKHKFEGTGLGLSICKKIIEQHEGEIYATSVLGEGSKFHFTISKNLI